MIYFRCYGKESSLPLAITMSSRKSAINTYTKELLARSLKQLIKSAGVQVGPYLIFLICVTSPIHAAIKSDKSGSLALTNCGNLVSSKKKNLSNSVEKQVSKILDEVESLEKRDLFVQAATRYSNAAKIIIEAEGACSINSGRFRLVYGTKLYRGLEFKEAEDQIQAGISILKLHNIANKEICEEYTGVFSFLKEIYYNKNDYVSFTTTFLSGQKLMEKCFKTQEEVTKPNLFDILIDLSFAFFAGYGLEKVEASRNEKAKSAFELLKKAYNIVDGKPSEMQLAKILLKDGYFKYIMAGLNEKNKTKDLLLQAKELTSQALQIHLKLKNYEEADGSARQLAYILEELGDYSQANDIYISLIVRALDSPLKATNLSSNFALLSGYALFTKNWGSKTHFKAALLKLRQWEHVAQKEILPLMTPTERLKYINMISQSEGVASRGLRTELLNPEDYLDSFLQLRYTLIESELIALTKNVKNVSSPALKGLNNLASKMELSEINYTIQIKESLKNKELFLQFIEAEPEGYNIRISENEIELATQAFIIRNSNSRKSLGLHKTCEKKLCNSLISDALRSSSEGLADTTQKWDILMSNLFTPALIEGIRESELIYIGLDGFLQRVPIGIIRRYLASKGLKSHRIIAVQSLVDMQHSDRKPSANNSAIFYSPEFGVITKCKTNTFCQKQWKSLIYSTREGESISEILSADKIFGKNASKSAILAIKNPEILHISTHAGFNDTTQALVAASSKFVEKQGLDGLYNLYIVASGANLLASNSSILNYNDFANWDLKGTSLVVLSACETGLGGSTRGYGLFGMHRILSSIGAESTLLSMWKVDDEATSVLMNLFYKNLKQGKTVDLALAMAQDSMIASPKYIARGWSHPYYWAGWQVAGKMNPIF